MKRAVGIAPGRLDFLGGVADYSGSLVLEMPISAMTRVEIAVLSSPVVRLVSTTATGAFEIPLEALEPLRKEQPAIWQRFLREQNAPSWSHYVLGCLWLFGLEMNWWPETGLLFEVDSQVPVSMGVSSSAALEVATLRALEALSDHSLGGTDLAKMAQRVENEVVGAPCGLMDQLSVAYGQAGALLPIVCRPDTLGNPIPLPKGVAVVGWPSGVKHAVSDAPYATARAAAFMGKKMLEAHFGHSLEYLTDLSPSQVSGLSESVLPAQISGSEFTDRFGSTGDPLSRIDAERIYPLRSSTLFPIEENFRCSLAAALLRTGQDDALHLVGELMAQSHEGYSAIGLGSAETNAMVEAVREHGPTVGFYGARVSGGGSGGTVVVLAREEAVSQLIDISSIPLAIIR